MIQEKDKEKNNDFSLQTISLVAHENECNRLNKLIHKLLYLIIFLVFIIFSIIAGIIYTVNKYNIELDKQDTVSINSDLSNNTGKNIISGGDYNG